MVRGSRRKFSSNAKKVNTAFKIARNNRKMMMGESKFITINGVGLDADTTVSVTLLTDVDQETGAATASLREGDMVYAKSLTLRLAARWQAAQNEATLRILVVQKKGQISTNPTIGSGGQGDVLEDLIPQTLAPPDFPARKLWKILMDEIYIGDPQHLENLVIKRFFKLKHKVYYRDPIATSNAQMGNIFLLLFSDIVSSTDCPQIDISSRFVYKDF